MKKCFVMLLTMLIAGSALAQEWDISISGEAKTGILWERVENRLGRDDSSEDTVRIHSTDDAGSGDGRFRINLSATAPSGNVGFNARLNWEHFNNEPVRGPHWDHAYGWGYAFDRQFRLSLGRLGGSPWGTGGPEMWQELEITPTGGMRFEFMPSFVPGYLNFGFVLNWIDGYADAGLDRDPTLLDLLLETVIGVSYRNDWFMARVAYRLDSELDEGAARLGLDIEREGTRMIYRVEEYVIRRFIPDLSVWALGEFWGIGSDAPEVLFRTRNWFFIQYAPPSFTADLRLGLDATGSRYVFHVRAGFEYNFDVAGIRIVPRIRFLYANDFGEAQIVPDSSFSHIGIHPSIRVDLTPHMHIALAYYWDLENWFGPPYPPERQRQRVNLRAGITF
ncbi:MAG: hypothetical protein FWB78_07570 [Treponema sp.]|nr:hypothetical protein [Treponema sp.]